MVDVMNQEQIHFDALRAVRGLTGVEAAAPVRRWPLQRSGPAPQRFWAAATPDDPINARLTLVSDDYLAMIGARLVEGRGIEPSDARGSVVVVDETMAERLRRSGPVLGSEVRTTNQRYRVIGVVRNMVYERPDERREPEVFLNVTASSALLVRLASGATERTTDGILSILAQIWGPTRAPKTLVSIEDEAARVRLPYVSQQRLLGALAVVTLFALTAGVLTTVALVLHRRRLDLGIRYALGAGRGDVRRVVWRDIVLVVTAGVAAGLTGGWVAGRVMHQYWYDITPLDPSTTWGVLVFLAVIVAAAIEWPVRRFQYVSPFAALKEE
jgi:predicted lysophospholipase L1 biosynthesis ABC-type transport system permease subunit